MIQYDFQNSLDFARQLDQQDPLATYRDQFFIPRRETGEEVYLVGNSLGLQPKQTPEYIQQELANWQTRGVRGHFESDFPWMPYHEFLTPQMAQMVPGVRPADFLGPVEPCAVTHGS